MLRTIVARRDWEGTIVLFLSVDGEEYLGITKVEVLYFAIDRVVIQFYCTFDFNAGAGIVDFCSI